MTEVDLVRSETGAAETLLRDLWPIMRSITGDGVRRSHAILSGSLPLRTWEVPTGTRVLDWEVPKEWRFNAAHVIGPDGRRIVDAEENNLHLVNYSVPFRGAMSLEALQPHLHSLPDQPTAIPYVTSYYEPYWGFCLRHGARSALRPGSYEVVVDTELFDGGMTMSEAVLQGETDQEILFSTYTCHPSMANNELSGPVATALLYRRIAAWPKRRYTYRFLFVPETIGSIAYLASNGVRLQDCLVAGFVVTCVGLKDGFFYKRSRRGDRVGDRAAALVLRGQPDARVGDFVPIGSDERQYCSPGFDLPVGSLTKGMYYSYPEYHTSLDNLDLLSIPALIESVDTYEKIARAIDANRVYRNRFPFGEPFLRRRGLHTALGAQKTRPRLSEAMLWLLNLADGTRDLLAIAERSGAEIGDLVEAIRLCSDAHLIEEI